MATWNFDPNMYQETEFTIIPAGDHRVRIFDVVERKFNSGNEGYEITLTVNGYNSKLWFYLVLDANDPKKTNQRIGDFFNSFGITDYSMGSGQQWVGKVGAVRVKHEAYNGNMSAKVAYVLNRKNQEKLAPWKNPADAAPTAPMTPVTPVINESDLPF